MAKIKPLEKNNRGMAIRLGILIFLISVGYFVSKQRNYNPPPQEPAVLSSETKNALSESNQNQNAAPVDLQAKSSEIAGDVLGQATQLAGDIASASAQILSSFVIDKTVPPIFEQIKKLPPDQQEEIKKNFCQ